LCFVVEVVTFGKLRKDFWVEVVDREPQSVFQKLRRHVDAFVYLFLGGIVFVL